MQKIKAVKPVPVGLSEFNDRRLILYACPKCGTSFEMLGRMEFACHNCNVALDWGTLPTKCSLEFRDKYEALMGREEKKEKKKEANLHTSLVEYVASFLTNS